MQLSQVIAGLEAAVETQLSVASPEASELGVQLMAALEPAIKQSFVDVLCAATAEINSQIPGHRIDVRLVDGDPELAVTPDAPPLPPPPPGYEDDEARITVRLPSYLKEIIAEAASSAGDSVNNFVIDALRSQAQTAKSAGKTRLHTTIEL